jgi:hypothetical protein
MWVDVMVIAEEELLDLSGDYGGRRGSRVSLYAADSRGMGVLRQRPIILWGPRGRRRKAAQGLNPGASLSSSWSSFSAC